MTVLIVNHFSTVHFLSRQETNQRKRPETNASTHFVKQLEIIQK